MREKFMRLMAGRYGNDQLNRFLVAVDLVLFVLAMLAPSRVMRLAYPLFLLLLFFTYYRMFSRNLYQRQRENAWYMDKRNRFLSSFRVLRERWHQRKDYCFYSCPSCRTTLRVPRGRGKIKIVCRKCGTSFVRRS